MADDTNTAEREAAEQWLRDRYGAYRGHFAWRELEEAFLAGRASLAASAGREPVAGIYQLSPADSAHDTITEVIKELRTYNPQADEHGGKFIHKGWANQLEAVAPPQISESDAEYWVRNRALILRAIEERGFRLVSSGGLFWLSGTANPSPPDGMAGWKPIATAPKDGTLILVHFKSKGVRAVSWDSPFHDEVTEENGIWCVDDDKHGPYGLRGYNDDGPTAPTHWMPLPAPPLPASEAKEL